MRGLERNGAVTNCYNSESRNNGLNENVYLIR